MHEPLPRKRLKSTLILGVVGLFASTMALLAPTPALANHFTPTLNIEPEHQTVPSNIFTGATITATITPSVLNTTFLDFEGVEDGDTPLVPDQSCTITAGGNSCTVVVAPSPVIAAGTLTIYGWIDRNNSNASCEADRQLGTGGACVPFPGALATDDEGVDEGADPGVDAEADGTDVVDVTFQFFPNPQLDCTPDTQTLATSTPANVNCRLTSSNGSEIFVANVLDATWFSGPSSGGGPGPLAPAGPPNGFNSTVGTPGNFSWTSLSAGTDVFCIWVDSDTDAQFAGQNGEQDGGQCNAEIAAGAANDITNLTDVVSVTWGSGGPPPPPGTSTITVTVQKKPGKPKSGVTATASPGGATCVTGGAGTCTITGLAAGGYTITNSKGFPCTGPVTVPPNGSSTCSKN